LRLLVFLIGFLAAVPASAQTVVEMELQQAAKLLRDHDLDQGVPMLTRLTNNYKKILNVRVQSSWYEEAMTALARALRTDFDGTGTGYIPDHTIWAIRGDSGALVYLSASLADKNALLMASDLGYLKGMIAYEILEGIRSGTLTLVDAQRKAMAVGIEMQVSENTEGERTITFFGHHEDEDKIIGRIMVIEPPEFIWK
jgi:hypothetical protein